MPNGPVVCDSCRTRTALDPLATSLVPTTSSRKMFNTQTAAQVTKALQARKKKAGAQ